MDVREKLVELRKEAAHYAICTCSAFQHCEDCPYRKCGTDCRDNIEMDYLIKKGVTVQEWISVKDRLPEIRERVLVYHDDGMIRFGINYGGFADVISSIYLNSQHSTPFSKVTHWNPLPQPPTTFHMTREQQPKGE